MWSLVIARSAAIGLWDWADLLLFSQDSSFPVWRISFIRGPFAKIRGLTLLLRVGTLWRCGDGLFFEVPPLASDALVITLHPLLEHRVTVVLKEHFLGWRRNLSGASALRDWKVPMDAAHRDRWNPTRTSAIQYRSRPMRFLGLFNHERELRGQNRLFRLQQTVCSTFSRSGWSVVRSTSLSKGGTSKERPSSHLHKVPTRSNKVSPWNFQTALIYTKFRKQLCLSLWYLSLVLWLLDDVSSTSFAFQWKSCIF
jgi:hypothetical protein